MLSKKIVVVILLSAFTVLLYTNHTNAHNGNSSKRESEDRIGITEGLSYGHLLRSPEGKERIRDSINEDVQLLADLGVKINRLNNWNTFRWDAIERSKGVFDWALSDYIVKKGQEAGICYVGTIYMVSYWGTLRPYVPKNWSDYTEFVKKTVERYDGDGVDDMPGLERPIKYWEFENEPAFVAPGIGRGMTPEMYVNILKHAYPAVKGADPKANVLLAGLMQTNQDYLIRLLDLGAGDYFDIMNYHFYSYKPDTEGVKETADSFKKILLDRGYSKPMWLTEIAACSKIKKGSFERDLAQSQACAVIKLPVVSFANGIDKVFWHTLRDGPDFFIGNDGQPPEGLNLGGGEAYYSLIEFEGYGGRKKPAYFTFKLLINKLDGFESVRELQPGAYQFRFKDKKPVYVLWSHAKSTIDLSEHISSKEVRVTHIIESPDQTEPKIELVPVHKIPVNESPVFVEAN